MFAVCSFFFTTAENKLSGNCVVLSDLYVDLLEKYHCNELLNIIFSYRVNATNCHLLVSLISDIGQIDIILTSGHNDLSSRNNFYEVVFSDNYVDL